MTAFHVTGEMIALSNRAQAAGLGNGVDYYVRGIPFSGQLGADLVGLSFDGIDYVIEHRRSDSTVEILRTSDFLAVQTVFLESATRLATAFEPRRDHRPDPPPPACQRRQLDDRLGAAIFGVFFGLFVVPLLIFVVLLAAQAGSYDPGSNGSGRWFKSRAAKIAFLAGAFVGLSGLAGAVVSVIL